MIDIVAAFSAGVLTFFSPCSFPMLPAYVALYMGIEENTKQKKFLKRGIINGSVSTFAFILVFSAIGLLTSLLTSVVNPYMRYIEPVIGIFLIILGVLYLSNMNLTLHFTIKSSKNKIFSFAILYALASIGCALPIFISMVLFALTRGGYFDAILVFLAYALGMGAMMIIINVLIAGAKQTAIKKIKAAMPIIKKLGSILLIVIGSYLIYYYYITWVA